jgi:protein MpaA
MRRCGVLGIVVTTLVALDAGCTRGVVHESEATESSARPLKPAAPLGVSEVVGRSVNGLPIEMVTFGGDGPRPVLVIGAIHGDESTSVVLARALVDELRRNPSAAGGAAVAVIPVMNPDGVAAGTRTNARKVDLNRNFPAANFAGSARRGREALSEPESQALADLIARLQPRLILSVHSMDKPCNNYDGPAKAVAERMSKLNGYPVAGTIGYPTPGSLGSWAGIDRQIPLITLELPRSLRGDDVWRTNREAVLAAIQFSRRAADSPY